MLKVALIGPPNVGKSLIFNMLTGMYVTVSNYPGTSIELARGKGKCCGKEMEVVDTPGMYSFIPLTEEEKITREVVCTEHFDVVVHVIDAKQVRRMLPMTLQLIEAGLPVLLNLNVMDEAWRLGMRFDCNKLSFLLGIPVTATSAVAGFGLDDLRKRLAAYRHEPGFFLRYDEEIEQGIRQMTAFMHCAYGVSARAAAVLLLQDDPAVRAVAKKEQGYLHIMDIVHDLSTCFYEGVEYRIITVRQESSEVMVASCLSMVDSRHWRLMDQVDVWVRQPWTGGAILLCVLYFGVYWLVGRIGAGYLVDSIQSLVFVGFLDPIIYGAVQNYLPSACLQDLFIGNYGVYSMGVRYVLSIILPIVGMFFVVFAFLEDSGYLPRLAMLSDWLLRRLGLNGRAIIPLTLGLGCGTMAVMMTRTLETVRERVLATFLLSLAIPCSAQLGVVLGLLAHRKSVLLIWLVCTCGIFALAGWLAGKILPGEAGSFYMEFPPLRIPKLSNLIKKVWTRVCWYLREIVPVFLVVSFVMWTAEQSGVLPIVFRLLTPVMGLLGLPSDCAQIFLLGFFRRDYGAAGLYDLCNDGKLNDGQLLVAAVVLTLFVPCAAQAMVMVKERGLLSSFVIISVVLGIAISAGCLLSWIMEWFCDIAIF